MKTEDEKLNEILVDALASALPGTSVDELDTGALQDDVSVGVDPHQAFVDAAIKAVSEGRSERGVWFLGAANPKPYWLISAAFEKAVEAVANEIEAGTTDFDDLRLLAAKHVFDAGGDPNDAYVVDAVIHAAGMTANGTRVIDRFERLVA
jgi:hypothetical protein